MVIKYNVSKVSTYFSNLRGSTEFSRAIGGCLKRDFTAPDYKFHDDPFLIPYNSMQKRDCLLSKQGGKRAARYVLNQHPELFNKKAGSIYIFARRDKVKAMTEGSNLWQISEDMKISPPDVFAGDTFSHSVGLSECVTALYL